MESALNGPSLQHYIRKRLKNYPRISRLRSHENQYKWNGRKFPVSIKKIDKFEENNPGIAVNVLFNNKKSQKKNIYTVRRPGRNGTCKKQVNLLMVGDGENRH